MHPRVYVDHTGPLNWHQRAWAAVLYAAPAYLYGPSAEPPRAEQLARPGSVPDPIHVAIDQSRRVKGQPGIVIHRIANLDSHAFGGTPPRLRLEDNALAMAHEARSEIDAVACLAQVTGRSYVTPTSLRAALGRFPSLRRRAWIGAIVDDLESGSHSVLEHGYLTKVERAHGLPPAERQSPRTTPTVPSTISLRRERSRLGFAGTRCSILRVARLRPWRGFSEPAAGRGPQLRARTTARLPLTLGAKITPGVLGAPEVVR